MWLIPLMALWANLHGSFIFGLAFTSFFALEAVLAARTEVEAALPAEQSRHEQDISTGSRANIRIQREISLFCSREVRAAALRWGAFLAAAICMALITPGGLKGFLYPFHVISMQNLPSIDEWRAENFQKPSALQFVLFCTLAVCLFRGVRMGAARLALLLLLVYMSLQHMRQEFILAVMAPLLLAGPLARALGTKAGLPPAPLPPFKKMIAPAAVMGTLFLALTLWRLASPGERIDQATVPVSALAHVPPGLRTRPVFNDYGFGGWLIFQGVKPFMDGRSDMYGDDLLKVYLDVSSGDRTAIDRTMSRYDIQWSILQPSSPLAAALDTRPGWRRIYSDKWAVVQARTESVPQAGSIILKH
ncbi:MAG: hypothetical protein JF605_20775 [Burkholderia sp.]|nr:hypothetical protein [Burkholderia sp.]